MKRVMIWTMAALLLAAGGTATAVEKETAADKQAPSGSPEDPNVVLAKKLAEEFMEYWQPDAKNYEKTGTVLPYWLYGSSTYFFVQFKPTSPSIKKPAEVWVDIEAAKTGWRHIDINDPSYRPGDRLKKICTRRRND